MEQDKNVIHLHVVCWMKDHRWNEERDISYAIPSSFRERILSWSAYNLDNPQLVCKWGPKIIGNWYLERIRRSLVCKDEILSWMLLSNIWLFSSAKINTSFQAKLKTQVHTRIIFFTKYVIWLPYTFKDRFEWNVKYEF